MPSSSEGSAGLWRSIGRHLVSFLRRCMTAYTRFCGLAWPGAAIGLVIAALFLPTYGGFCIGTGLGTIVDVAGCLLVGAIAFALATLLLMLILAITRRIIEAHLGSISVESELGKGSTFTVRLPWHLQEQPRLDSALAEDFEEFTRPRLEPSRELRPKLGQPLPAGSSPSGGDGG